MSWSNDIIQKVWIKGKIESGYNSDEWRKDDCDAWIGRNFYGNRNSDKGWEIDHISSGGSDELSNLRPLQWQNNVDKSDGRLKCNVTSLGAKNVVNK